MDAWFHKNFHQDALRRGATRWHMPAGGGEWLDFREKAFRALLIVAPLFVFLVILAWDWLPFNAPAPPEAITPETARLMALTEDEMRARVWPVSAEAIEADQPEFGGKPVGDLVSVSFARCGAANRVTCVVDGATFWFRGEKVRIADIDTPEVRKPGCSREAELGDRATDRLIALLNAGPFTLRSTNSEYDQYGRRLLMVTRGGNSLGAVLVREGLAERWGGPRIDWCSR